MRDEFSLERRRKTNLKFIKLQRWIGFLRQKYSFYLTDFFLRCQQLMLITTGGNIFLRCIFTKLNRCFQKECIENIFPKRYLVEKSIITMQLQKVPYSIVLIKFFWGVSSVPFPFQVPFHSHFNLVSSIIALVPNGSSND